MPINILNVVSMIIAIRANVALYFEIRDSLQGLNPLLKYVSCRAVLSCALSQRFLLDATILDPVARFELLNVLLCVEMLVLSVAWWFIFSPSDPVFRHIMHSADVASPTEGAATEGLTEGLTEELVLEERTSSTEAVVAVLSSPSGGKQQGLLVMGA